MHPEWSREQIMTLAPDAQVVDGVQIPVHLGGRQRPGYGERAKRIT